MSGIHNLNFFRFQRQKFNLNWFAGASHGLIIVDLLFVGRILPFYCAENCDIRQYIIIIVCVPNILENKRIVICPMIFGLTFTNTKKFWVSSFRCSIWVMKRFVKLLFVVCKYAEICGSLIRWYLNQFNPCLVLKAKPIMFVSRGCCQPMVSVCLPNVDICAVSVWAYCIGKLSEVP